MAKLKVNCVANEAGKATLSANAESSPSLIDLREDSDLWYKIHVLIYDLRNLSKDLASEARTLCTTDELYISSPYFTPPEASMIKSTIIEVNHTTVNEDLELSLEDVEPSTSTSISTSTSDNTKGDTRLKSMTIEEAIKNRLANFFDKRKASGDSRPCGPHDMAPIYEKVFGISNAEIQDERFLSRLRRSGLPSNNPEKADITKQELKAKQKKGGKKV